MKPAALPAPSDPPLIAFISTTLPCSPIATKHCACPGSVSLTTDAPTNTTGCSRLCRTRSRDPGRRRGRKHRRPSGRPQRITGDLARAASIPKRSLKRTGSRWTWLSDKVDDGSPEWTQDSTGLLLIPAPSVSPCAPAETSGRLKEPSTS